MMQSYLTERTQSVMIESASSVPHPLTVGLPQGSLVGPGEFPTYSSPMFHIARKHGIEIHMYADDTQLYISFPPCEYAEAVAKMEGCLTELKQWMSVNHLKLNEEKTEFLVIGQKTSLQKIDGPHTIVIGDAIITAAEKAKNIGAVMDNKMNMISHVNHISRSCYVHLRNIGRIRPNLTEDAAATIVHAFVSSKLDNSNSLLYGVPECVTKKLQLIQNNAARIVTRSRKHEHVTPILKRLHWLPIRYRIQFKICLMAFKCLHGKAPTYLSDLLVPYEPARTLRSGSQCLLTERRPRLKKVGDRAFAAAAPKLWNMLPEDLRKCQDLEAFKKDLKTHLYREAFE